MLALRSGVAARVMAALTIAALALLVSVSGAATTPLDSAQVAPYVSLRIDPPNPCITDTVFVVVTDSCGPCLWPLGSWAPAPTDARIFYRIAPLSVCAADPCAPLRQSARLGLLPSGQHMVTVTVTVQVPEDSTHAASQFSFRKQIAFNVAESCGTKPPILDYLPGVEYVYLVGSTTPCDSCPPHVCAGKPVVVRVGGHTTNPCFQYDGARILPTMSAVDRPIVVLDFTATCAQVCLDYTPAWADSFTLPAGVAGPHGFAMQVAINACPDSMRRVIAHKTFRFATDSCAAPPPTTIGCVDPFLIAVPVMGYLTNGCNLVLPPGGTGVQSFAIRSDSLALAGLQGVVSAGAGLRILRLTPAGPAAGMHIVTRQSGPGEVKYVLYSDSGVAIPAGGFERVIDVSVKADSTLRVGGHSWISGTVTAASDESGSSLPMCTIETFAPVVAWVCIEPAATCDANGDGVTNVADLVRMARCWLRPQTCPDTLASRPDCDGDGVFGVSDIFCCARTILGGGPRDSTHAAPGLTLAFGAPTLEQGLVHVALEVHGASAMNGALLRVRFPAERYAYVPPTDAASTGAQWLPLTEPGAGDVVIGVLRLDDAAPDAVTVPLVFRLLDGQLPGGALTADQGQVIAPDGSSIAVDLGGMTTNLPSTTPPVTFARVELLCGPNPASGSTRFVVRLPQGAPVDLGIFDVAGRRVETLYRGSLASGETAFTWQPRTVRGGLYFARLAVNGVVRTTRVTLQLAR